MTYKELKIGDRIRILENPHQWSSRTCGNIPIQGAVTFPFEAEIEEIEECSNHTAAKIGNYGWSLDCIKFELINTNEYSIY